LAKCLLASISSDLSVTLINRVPPKYRNDGTYLLWALCNNIYHNNIAFVESIREKIVNSTVLQHDGDIEEYLIFIKNQLHIITAKSRTTTHFNGLITYMLHQLKTTSNQIFLRYIQDLHVSYQEGTLPRYTPWKLILDVEDKIRVLCHAEVWELPTTKETPAMALNFNSTTLADQLKEFLANHITAEVKRLTTPSKATPTGNDTNRDSKQRTRPPNPDWLYTTPQTLDETKTVNNRTYKWCAKCNRGNGQWIITHTTATHKDDYVHPSKCQEGPRRPTQQHIANAAQMQPPTAPPQDTSPTTPGQLSLPDGITNAFRFDVTDFDEED